MMHFKEKIPADPHPLPPHARRAHIQINYEDDDWPYFCWIFGDEDTAKAAIMIAYAAPPEVQIIIYQLFLIIKETMKEVAL